MYRSRARSRGRVRAALAIVLCFVCLLAGALTAAADAAAPESTKVAPTTANSCPLLILSAMPLELDPILVQAHVDPVPVYTYDGRGFWSGKVEGNRAIFAVTHIGMVNATQTTEAAFAHFGCFSGVVFSGTSGGDYIGDVLVPVRWTEGGKNVLDTSPAMLAALKSALRHPIALQQSTPVGDPLCICQVTGEPSVNLPITVEHKPQVEVGGTGLSNDGFGGRAFPCVPAATDVFGCWPCVFANTESLTQTANLLDTLPPLLEPSFITDYLAYSAEPTNGYVSEDNETAAVFTVAASHHVPFIGFRAASDGGGDPLGLPGYPSQFFVYDHLAADNAAATALAFLQAWHRSHP